MQSAPQFQRLDRYFISFLYFPRRLHLPAFALWCTFDEVRRISFSYEINGILRLLFLGAACCGVIQREISDFPALD